MVWDLLAYLHLEIGGSGESNIKYQRQSNKNDILNNKHFLKKWKVKLQEFILKVNNIIPL